MDCSDVAFVDEVVRLVPLFGCTPNRRTVTIICPVILFAICARRDSWV